MTDEARPWDIHYGREKSVLLYPDENLVRLLRPYLEGKTADLMAVDLGCGSGRHIRLMKELGIGSVLGLDNSFEALRLCRDLGLDAVRGEMTKVPLESSSVDIAVAWGSLHYSPKGEMKDMLAEIHRVLKEGGRLFGTLRTTRDTYLRKGKHLGDETWITDLSDIRSSLVSFFSEEELKGAMRFFARSSYGLMERSAMGDTARVISHWFFWAEK